MNKITVAWLQDRNACISLDEMKEAEKIGDPIKILNKLMKKDRFNDANWVITKCMNKKQCVQYAIFAAELVIDIFEKIYPNDKRPRLAIEMAKKYLKKQSQKNKIAAAAAAAADAAADAAAACAAADAAAAYAAADAAADAAAYAAVAAAAAADAAAYAAADAAADAAAYAAAAAADAAADAADADADAIKEKIINYGIKLLKGDDNE
jgi:hypothetical protein